jgi:SAM-dependent methyltransferase
MQNTARSSQAVVNCALRDLEAGYRELAMYSASKPGYEAVAHVESSAQFIGRAVNALQLLVDQKANGNEVRQMFDDVRNSILMVERGKADEREMSRINAKLDDARNAVNLLSTSKVDLDVLYGVRHDLIKTLETKAERREVSEEILAVRDAATHGIADLRESKAERSTVDHALDVLKRALGPKAERHELTDLTNYLVSLVQCRITREEVVALDQSIRDAIQVLSEVKADRAAVDATNDKLQSAVTSVRSATMASVDEMLGPLKGSIELLAHLKIDRVALDSALAETKAVTESAVNALSQSINALADTKADRTTLDNALGDAKAVTDSAVNTLTQSIRTLIDAKADRMTLDAVHNEFLDAQRRLEEALDTMAQLKLDRPMLDSALAQTNSATESALSALHQSIGALMTGKADSAAFDAKHGEIREGLRRLEGTLDALALSKIDGPMLEGVLAKSAATTETALHALAQSLKALVDGKVDLSTFDATSERVQAALDEVRADTTRNMDAALQSLRGALDSLAKTKSDRDALDAIKADGKAALDDALARVNSQTRDIKRNVLDQERRIALLLEEARKRLPKPISPRQIKEMLREEDHLMDAMYARFEDIFRGTREDIKHRQEIYLPYMKAAKAGSPSAPIIDVGCGRGEWLEVLRDAGLNGRGADLNRVFLAGCRDLGLDVSELDGVAYLRSLSPNSVGAVTSFHLVEHLDQKTMIALFDAAFHVLQPGGIAIFETPNPRNLQVGSCSFYLDPTHRHPLPPELLQYLLEARGFVDIQLTELHPPSPEKRVTTGSTMVNETLNRFFFSAQDYAVIGRKA